MDYKKLIEYSISNKNIVFFSGSFTKKPSIFLSELVENTLEEDLTRKIKNRTLFLLIEILQNIEKYSFHHSKINDDFIMVNDINELTISASNVIENKNIDNLKSILEKVEESNKDELTKMFHDKLTSSVVDDSKKSPGLGLIEIRRKNKKSYNYSFTKINNQYTRYEITVSIEKKDETEINNTLISKLRNYLFQNNQVIGYVGDFENSSISSILNLVNRSNFSDDGLLNSKYHHSLIELVQNSKEHGKVTDNVKNGFFLIENNDNNITISCCNETENSKPVKKIINNLNELSDEELTLYSKDALLDDTKDGGLGLIQFARYSRPSPLIQKSFFINNDREFYYIEGEFNK